MSEVARTRGDAVTVSEHSAAGDSQGNDFIERAVRNVEEMENIEASFGGSHLRNPEDYSQSDSVVD